MSASAASDFRITMVAGEHMNACIYTDPLEPPVREDAMCGRRTVFELPSVVLTVGTF